MNRTSTLHRAAVVLGLVSLACAAGPAARALPVPEVDRTRPSATPSPPPAGIGVLPVGSPLYFVLDDGLSSSRSRAGDVIHMHLRDPLIVNGAVIAPAGSAATMTVVRTHHAASGDNDGSIQVTVQPLPLPTSGVLPIRAVNEYLTIDHTAGQLSTRDATDTAVDVFIPTYILWQALRKGHEYVLQPGAVVRVMTAAAVDARDPHAIAVVSPPPLLSGGDMPHSVYTPVPFYTPAPEPTRRPKGKPAASPSPSPVPSASPTSPASAAPAPTGSA